MESTLAEHHPTLRALFHRHGASALAQFGGLLLGEDSYLTLKRVRASGSTTVFTLTSPFFHLELSTWSTFGLLSHICGKCGEPQGTAEGVLAPFCLDNCDGVKGVLDPSLRIFQLNVLAMDHPLLPSFDDYSTWIEPGLLTAAPNRLELELIKLQSWASISTLISHWVEGVVQAPDYLVRRAWDNLLSRAERETTPT